MGISLIGRNDGERLSFSGWGSIQLLALLHGWVPEGTYYDHDGPTRWLGYYYNATSGQRVADQDARNMAQALRRAVASLANVDDPQTLELAAFTWPEVLDDPEPPEDWRDAFVTWGNERARQRLAEIAKFCDAGTFHIA
jgi:hypothetical protein